MFLLNEIPKGKFSRALQVNPLSRQVKIRHEAGHFDSCIFLLESVLKSENIPAMAPVGFAGRMGGARQ